LTEGRVDGAVDYEKPNRKNDEHYVVEGEVVADVEEAEHRPPRHSLNTVLTSRERRLQAEEVHHLRQRQRHHGEVDALPANSDGPGHYAHQHGHSRAREDAKLRRPAPPL